MQNSKKERKQISVIYNDTAKTVARYDGELIKENQKGILLLSKSNKEIFIPKAKIIRTERQKEIGEN